MLSEENALPIIPFTELEQIQDAGILARTNAALAIIHESFPLPENVTDAVKSSAAQMHNAGSFKIPIIVEGNTRRLKWFGRSPSCLLDGNIQNETLMMQARWITSFFAGLERLGEDVIDWIDTGMLVPAHNQWQSNGVIMYFINQATLPSRKGRDHHREVVSLICLVDKELLQACGQREVSFLNSDIVCTGNPFYSLDGKSLTYNPPAISVESL